MSEYTVLILENNDIDNPLWHDVLESGPNSGAEKVRLGFNVSGDEAITALKVLGAAFIDVANSYGKDPRETAMARSDMEYAVMRVAGV